MSKPVRSARGEMVDFDLLKIKQQIAATPKSAPVQARENFIDQRFKRRLKRSKAPVVADPAVEATADDTDNDQTEE